MRNTSVSVRLLSLALVLAPFGCKQQQGAAVKEGEDSVAASADPLATDGGDSAVAKSLDDALEVPVEEQKPGTLVIEGTEETADLRLTGKAGLKLGDGNNAAGDPPPTADAAATEDTTPLTLAEMFEAEEKLDNPSNPEASLRLADGSDDSDIQGVAVLAKLAEELTNYVSQNGGDDSTTTTTPGGTASGNAVGGATPDQKGLTELRLADDKDVSALKTELASAKAALARIEARIKRLEAAGRPSSSLLQAQQTGKDPCLYDRAYKKGNVCQCRAWNLDVVGATFPVPRTNTVRAFNGKLPPKCKLYEKDFCVGDATKAGQCGLFGKNVGYNTPAIATANRVSGETAGECWLTIDKLVADNHARVFAAPTSCGRDIAIQRGKVIEMWEYNTSTGAFVKQITGVGPAGGIPTTTLPGSASRLNPNSSVAASVQSFNNLCVSIQSTGGKRAEWTATMAGGGGCRCGGRSVSATTYLTSYSAADRTAFPTECREFLGR